VIYKINEYGDTIFSTSIPNRGTSGCSSSGDGGAVFSGSGNYPYSVKINSFGNEVWNNVYNSGYPGSGCDDLIKTSDNHYIMIGGGRLVKIDFNGNFIWQKSLPDGFSINYLSIVEAIDGGYVLGGRITDYLGGPIIGIVTKTDTSGTKIWSSRFSYKDPSNGVQDLKITKTSYGYFAGGYAWNENNNKEFILLFKIDLAGNIKDSLYYYQLSNDNNFFWDIKTLSDNRIIVLYHRLNSGQDSTLSAAFITDTLGNVIAHREYSGTDLNYLTKINVTPPNTIFFAGISNHLNKYQEWPYVVKTDSTLYAPPVSVSSLSTTIPDRFSLKQNYPNPFNSTTQIEFGISKRGQYSLKIYDVSGKLISELFNQTLEPGEYKTDFNASNYSSGVYFYKLESSKSVITKKLVLLK
jgi:hypothetical protein